MALQQLGPADLPKLLEAIQSAIAPDGRSCKRMTAFFENCQKIPGYCALLTQIIANTSIPFELRLFATICLKNCVHKAWKPRRRDQNPVSDPEKALVRTFLLNSLASTINTTIANQLCLVFGKVSRFDWPESWPELFPSLSTPIQSGRPEDPTVQFCLKVMCTVVQGLVSRRLPRFRQSVRRAAGAAIDWVFPFWKANSVLLRQQIEELLKGGSFAFKSLSASCVVCCKMLRILVVDGLGPQSLSNPAISAVLQMVGTDVPLFQHAWEAVRADGRASSLLPHLEKICLNLFRIADMLRKMNSLGFLPFLEAFLGLSFSLQKACAARGGRLCRRLDVAILNFLAAVLSDKSYMCNDRRGSFDETSASAPTVQARKLLSSYFHEANIAHLLQYAVLGCFPLQESELALWGCDPEEFVASLEAQTTKEHIRPSAEHAFLALLDFDRERVARQLLELRQSIEASMTGVPDLQHIQRLDGVYLAMGLGPYALHEIFEFEPWFDKIIFPLLKPGKAEDAMVIVRRRVLWLVSCWVGQVREEIRGPFYSAVCAMTTDGDLVVQLSAVHALEAVVKDWAFNPEVFAPLLLPASERLFDMAAAGSGERGSACLELVAVMVRAVGNVVPDAVHACTESLFANITSKWERFSLAHTKALVLDILVAVFAVIGGKGSGLVAPILPVIGNAVTAPPEAGLLLRQVGAKLWKEAAQLSVEYTKEMHDLFPALPGLVSDNLDLAREVLAVLKAYLLLAGPKLLEAHPQAILTVLDRLVDNVTPAVVRHVVGTLEVLFFCSSPTLVAMVTPVIQRLLTAIFDPSTMERLPAQTVVAHLTVLARAMVHSPQAFLALFSSNPAGMVQLCDLWRLHLRKSARCMPDPRHRKLFCMALCLCLQTGSLCFFEHIQDTLEMCGRVEGEMQRRQSAAFGKSRKGPGTPHAARLEAALKADVVSLASVTAFLRETLEVGKSRAKLICVQTCRARLGPAAFQQNVARRVAPPLLRRWTDTA